MLEAASTSETSVSLYQSTRRYMPEDSHRRASLKFNGTLDWRYYVPAQFGPAFLLAEALLQCV
jgi:hypothetical protein